MKLKPLRPTPRLCLRKVILLAAAAVFVLLLLAAPRLPGAGVHAAGFCDDTGVSDISLAECRVLEEFYTSTGGANWTGVAKQGWLQDTTACTWAGITCTGDGTAVSSIIINAGNLSGPLPASLGSLSELTALDLTENQLNGALPAELGKLSKLEDLSLGSNQLSGQIPPELGDLSELQNLDLGNNLLEGAIPEELGKLDKITIAFFLDGNRLEGPVPKDICTMSNNFLTGSLDYNKLDIYNTPLSCDARFANWILTQTVPPLHVTAASKAVNTIKGTTDVSADITIAWTPISYQLDGGYYEVFARHLTNNTIMSLGTTADKSVAQLEITFQGDPKLYAFYVVTHTASHARNQSALTSENSEEAILDAVAVRLLDIEANTPLLYIPAVAPLLLLVLTAVAALLFRRR